MLRDELLELGEYASLIRTLEKKPSLSAAEQRTLVEAKAGALASHEALLLYEKFHLADKELLARLHLLAGDAPAALALLPEVTDPHTRAEVFLANKAFAECADALKDAALDGRWYYLMGRAARREKKFPRAETCLKRAMGKFRAEKKPVQSLLAWANLGSLWESQGKLLAAARVFRQLESSLAKMGAAKEKNFPQSLARLHISAGLFFQNAGQIRRALLLLTRAKHLLAGAQDSRDFLRASLLLGHAQKDAGLFHASRETLRALLPSDPRQKLDQSRCLAICHAALGDPAAAETALKAARENLEAGDTFGKLYLEADTGDAHALLGRNPVPPYQEAIKLAKAEGDEVAAAYAESRLMLWQRHPASTRLLAFHERMGLRREAAWNRLALAYAEAAAGNFPDAIAWCEKNIDSDLPPETIETYLLAGACQLRQRQLPQAAKSIKLALTLLKDKDLHSLLYSALYLAAFYELDPRELGAHWEKFRALGKIISPIALRRAEAWLSELDLHDKRRYSFAGGGLSREIGQAERRLAREEAPLLIEGASREVLRGGKSVLTGSKQPALWELVQALTESWPDFLGKEALALRVFGKTYNPLSDDNRLYVAVNRLRKLTGRKDLIEVQEGGYRLALSGEIQLITRALPTRPDPAVTRELLSVFLARPEQEFSSIRTTRSPEETRQALDYLVRRGILKETPGVNAPVYRLQL